MSKDTWSKPELIVLLRDHPEETLQDPKCKHPISQGPGSINPAPACAENNAPCHNSSEPS